jgi:branched-subunit amino acid transport protein
MIWVVPINILATSAVTSLIRISPRLITRERHLSPFKDQRHRKFGFWGLGGTLPASVAVFLSATVTLATRYSGFITANLIYLGFDLTDVSGSSLKPILYRTGS